ncbi:MAG: right-handed parallel beta-helix repeat-containing protein [Ruminococcaceae bacterium]|nr:right-handed parallel beta-helix repeat-containing protein [Oscillospiraceae bacterium]
MYNYNNCSTIFVSQKNGCDDLSGLTPAVNGHDGPLKTVEKAIETAAELRVGNNMRPLTIAFCDDYFLSQAIEIDPLKITGRYGPSYGIDGITFRSFGKRRKIVGGIKLEDWQKDVFNGKECISCSLSKNKNGEYPTFTDLIINGKRAQFTRYPKNGTLTGVAVENPHPVLWEIHHPSKWFDAHTEDLANIKGIEDAIVSFYHYWIDEHSPVESYDKKSGRMVLKYPSRFTISTQYDPPITSDLHYYLENLPDFFETENEWYLDKSSGKVYYMPSPDLDIESIEAYAPTCKSLFEIEGTQDKPISDIRISDLDLLCTRGDYASRGFTSVSDEESEVFASDAQSVCLAHGAVNFRFAQRCAISDCHLYGLGVHSVNITEGCRKIRIENNIIEESAAGGVRIFGKEHGCEPSCETSDIIIRRNTIKNIGLRYEAACGILICHAHDNEISENEICYTGYSGISCGWVWGYKDSITYGNILRDNHIHHIGRGKMSDLGAIYTLGIQKGTVISGNHIHDITSFHYGANGIYLDEGSSGILVENNLVYDAKTASFLLHYGKDNVIRNNIFAFGELGVEVGRREMHENLIFERNIFVTEDKPLIARSDFSPYIVDGNNNIVFDTKNEKPTMHASKETSVFHASPEFCDELAKTFGAVFCDPKFVDVKARNFDLSEDSPVFELIGFEKLNIR